MIFPADGARLNFFFLEYVWCESDDCHVDFDSQLWFQNLSLKTIYDEKCHVLYCIVSRGHWRLLYVPFLCACINIHDINDYISWNEQNSLVITIILHWLIDWVEDNLFLVVWRSLPITSSSRGVLSGITVIQGQPLCSFYELLLFCLRFCNPSCALLNSTCIHSCFTMHFEFMFMYKSWLLTFGNQKLSLLIVSSARQSLLYHLCCCHMSGERAVFNGVRMKLWRTFMCRWLFP